jgi:hypothetical protein
MRIPFIGIVFFNLLLISGLFADVQTTKQWAGNAADWRLDVAMVKKTFKQGEPVELVVRITNITGGPLKLLETRDALDYEVHIIDSHGRSPKLTKEGKADAFPEIARRTKVVVAAGGSREGTFDLQRMFVLKASKYRITVRRVLLDGYPMAKFARPEIALRKDLPAIASQEQAFEVR